MPTTPVAADTFQWIQHINEYTIDFFQRATLFLDVLRQRRPSVRRSARSRPRRPIIIIDPRSGHGTGTGSAKEDSEIGMALNQGYPVYMVLFSAWPVSGQTLDHVQRTLAHFVEAVHRRHPEAANPAVVGNCRPEP